MITQIIKVNALLKLQPECMTFESTTRLQIKKLINYYQILHAVEIPFKYEYLPWNKHISDLKPLRTKKDIDDLNIAEHKFGHS